MALVEARTGKRVSDRQAVALALLVAILPFSLLSVLRCQPHLEIGRVTVYAGLTDGNMADGCREMFGAYGFQEDRQGLSMFRVGGWLLQAGWLRRDWDWGAGVRVSRRP
jgi:hypothetical protein